MLNWWYVQENSYYWKQQMHLLLDFPPTAWEERTLWMKFGDSSCQSVTISSVSSDMRPFLSPMFLPLAIRPLREGCCREAGASLRASAALSEIIMSRELRTAGAEHGGPNSQLMSFTSRFFFCNVLSNWSFGIWPVCLIDLSSWSFTLTKCVTSKSSFPSTFWAWPGDIYFSHWFEPSLWQGENTSDLLVAVFCEIHMDGKISELFAWCWMYLSMALGRALRKLD